MFSWVMYFGILYFCGLFSFAVSRKHLLLMLLSLEFVVLSLFSFLVYFLLYFGLDSYFGMIFISFSVGEGALGLSLLVLMVRTHGGDYMKTFNVLW